MATEGTRHLTLAEWDTWFDVNVDEGEFIARVDDRQRFCGGSGIVLFWVRFKDKTARPWRVWFNGFPFIGARSVLLVPRWYTK